jgi:hypothetical protein
MITKEATYEFQRLYFEEFGVKLPDKKAVEYGDRLVGFVQAVYGNDLASILFDNKPGKRDN